MKKNRGFTLLEIIVVCGIILIMSSLSYQPISDRMDKNAIMEAKTKIRVTLDNLSIKSNNYGAIYDVTMDFEEKNILISKDGVAVDKVELPKQLEYEDVNGKKIINRRTTPNGNMSKPFSVYITDKKKKNIFYRITVDTTSSLRIVIIRNYKPTDKITSENYREEKYEKLVWVKE